MLRLSEGQAQISKMYYKEYLKEWRANNPEKVKQYARNFYYSHLEKSRKWKKDWRNKNPNYMRDYHKLHAEKLLPMGRDRAYRRKYGISLAQYEILLRKQKGLCLLCLKPPKKYRLAIDHNHKTGKIRGLLCFVCNRTVIGRIDSIPGFLKRLLKYVK